MHAHTKILQIVELQIWNEHGKSNSVTYLSEVALDSMVIKMRSQQLLPYLIIGVV